MNRVTKYTIYLSIWIVIMCTTGILFTYLNDTLQSSGFFGDTKFIPKNQWETSGVIDTEHLWGARHYWYFWMCTLLFLLSVVRVIFWSYWYWDEDSQRKHRQQKIN